MAKKTYFEGNTTYSQLVGAQLFLTGIEYAIDPMTHPTSQTQNQEELSVYKKVVNWLNAPANRTKRSELANHFSKEDLEIYEMIKENFIKKVNNEFNGKDIHGKVVKTGKDLVKWQEMNATSCKYILIEKPYIKDKFNRYETDNFNEDIKLVAQKGDPQNSNNKIVPTAEHIGEIRRMINDAGGMIAVDFKDGYLNPISPAVDVLFAEKIIVGSGNNKKEIPIPISPINASNVENDFNTYSKAGDWNKVNTPTSNQPQKQEQHQTSQSQSKKEEK